MKYNTLRILGVLVGISLIGVVLTQLIWLKKSADTARLQFDHRADEMLTDVVQELTEYVDTSKVISVLKKEEKLTVFDAIDTVLLSDLLAKYINYHRLDSVYSYAIVKTISGEVIYSTPDYLADYDEESYKSCLSCIWKKEYLHLSVFFPNRSKNMLSSLIGWMILSTSFLTIIGLIFVYIIVNIYRQKKIDEIRNDFINNMTHEFKTPIATISLASEILAKARQDTPLERINKYSRVIYDENLRMRKQVEQVLNIASMDRGLVVLNKREINFHDLVYKSVEGFCLEACEKKVNIKYELNAKKADIYADPLHIRNVITNLVDNAIKYSGIYPDILLSTENNNGGILFKIKDNGIGISKDDLKHVFDKFYRVSTGNIHDVKGFGLGLYYVKTMIEAHDGEVDIESAPKQGSVVNVYLPQE